MQYKFMGTPDALYPNLKTGGVYVLDVYRCQHTPNNGEIIAYGSCLAREREQKIGWCPYQTWKAFYRNWLPYYGE